MPIDPSESIDPAQEIGIEVRIDGLPVPEHLFVVLAQPLASPLVLLPHRRLVGGQVGSGSAGRDSGRVAE